MRGCAAEERVPVPPKAGQNAANGISDSVPRIADSPRHDVRADGLKQDGPNDHVKGDFAPGGGLVVGAQAQPALEQAQTRQRAGN